MAEAYARDLQRRLGSRVFARDDELARQQGWTIETGRLGLSRTYRHPGFPRRAKDAASDAAQEAGDISKAQRALPDPPRPLGLPTGGPLPSGRGH